MHPSHPNPNVPLHPKPQLIRLKCPKAAGRRAGRESFASSPLPWSPHSAEILPSSTGTSPRSFRVIPPDPRHSFPRWHRSRGEGEDTAAADGRAAGNYRCHKRALFEFPGAACAALPPSTPGEGKGEARKRRAQRPWVPVSTSQTRDRNKIPRTEADKTSRADPWGEDFSVRALPRA